MDEIAALRPGAPGAPLLAAAPLDAPAAQGSPVVGPPVAAAVTTAPVSAALPVRLWHGGGRMWHRINEDRILGMSAEAGFWGLISLPSLVLGIFGSLGYLKGVRGHQAILRVHDDVIVAAGHVLSPSTVSADVAPLVDQTLGRGQAGLVSISFVVSLWSGSSATSAYLNTITVAYRMRGLRSAVRSRLVALGLYLLSVLTGIALLPGLVLGPDVVVDLFPVGTHVWVATAIGVLYWPVMAAGSVLVLAALYRLCLPVRLAWRRHLPGAVLAMLIWLAGSDAVRMYAETKLRANLSYGALGAPLAALLFFYVTALAVLLGAELNAALHPYAPLPPVAGLPVSAG